MDSTKFDVLVRGFSLSGNRRKALAALFGIGAGAALLEDAGAERCRKAGQKCNKDNEPRGNRTKCCEGSKCKNGLCVCSRGQTACYGKCVNTLNDPGNCGACNTACPVEAPICWRGSCVGCTEDSQCPESHPVCDGETGQCVGCTSNSQCHGNTPYCNKRINVCVQCRGNGDCSQGEACVNGTCGCTEECLNSPCNVGCGSCGYCDGEYECVNGKCGYPQCDAESCPLGCCNGYECVQYADQSDSYCGSGGDGCNDCAYTESCINGMCQDEPPPPPPGSCDENTCPEGCCAEDGECVLWIDQSDSYCGTAAESCAACASGVSCIDGQCGGPCDHSTCPSGCCDGNVCRTASDSTCGTAGSACQNCGGGTCVNGSCGFCDADTCPNGCCDGNICVPYGQQDFDVCGTGGEACAACFSQMCQTGQCVTCDATSCEFGCCANAWTCVSITDQTDSICGTNGQSCQACPSGDTCTAGVCGALPCDGTTCPNGCCDVNDTCVPYADQSMVACGTGGAACSACITIEQCSAGVCVACNASTCSTGCCNGSTCVPYASQTNAICGTNGVICTACTGSDTCDTSNGTCIPSASCSSLNCPTGCCQSSTCVQDFDQTNSVCGYNGDPCVACTGGAVCNTLNGICELP